MISINMDKAREIHKENLREMRKPILEKLDVEFMKAFEVNNTERIQEITTLKQELRDVTQSPLIVQAETPEELKNAIPEILVNQNI